MLETLGIFGIHADYMAQFRDFLEEEGLPTNDDRIEFLLPVIKNLGTQKLKTIRLKKTINGVSTEFGDAFRKLGADPDRRAAGSRDAIRGTAYLQKNQVVLNWYPKIQAMKSRGLAGGDAEAAPNQAHLSARHVAFLDLDRALLRAGAVQGRARLVQPEPDAAGHRRAARGSELVPAADPGRGAGLRFVRAGAALAGDRAGAAQEVHRALLHLPQARVGAAAPRVSRPRRRRSELPRASKESPDEGYYRILIDRSQEEIVAKLEELKAAIEKGDLKPWEFQGMKAIWFGKHLYQPLLYLDSNDRRDQPGAAQQGRAPVRRGSEGVPRRRTTSSSRTRSCTCCAT